MSEVVSEVAPKPTKKRTTKPKKNTPEVVVSENIESIQTETLEVPSEVVVSEEVVPQVVSAEVAPKPTKKRTTKPKKNTQEVVAKYSGDKVEGVRGNSRERSSSEFVSENIESIAKYSFDFVSGIRGNSRERSSSVFVPELMSEVMPEVIVNVSENVIADNHVGETCDNGDVGCAVGADNLTFAIMDNIISNTLENNTYDLITQTQTQIDEYINDDDFEDILAESFVYEGVSYFIDEENRIFHPQTLLQIGVFQPNTLSVTFL